MKMLISLSAKCPDDIFPLIAQTGPSMFLRKASGNVVGQLRPTGGKIVSHTVVNGVRTYTFALPNDAHRIERRNYILKVLRRVAEKVGLEVQTVDMVAGISGLALDVVGREATILYMAPQG